MKLLSPRTETAPGQTLITTLTEIAPGAACSPLGRPFVPCPPWPNFELSKKTLAFKARRARACAACYFSHGDSTSVMSFLLLPAHPEFAAALRASDSRKARTLSRCAGRMARGPSHGHGWEAAKKHNAERSPWEIPGLIGPRSHSRIRQVDAILDYLQGFHTRDHKS